MVVVQVKTEKGPKCNIKIKWSKEGADDSPKGYCPKCGREFKFKIFIIHRIIEEISKR